MKLVKFTIQWTLWGNQHCSFTFFHRECHWDLSPNPSLWGMTPRKGSWHREGVKAFQSWDCCIKKPCGSSHTLSILSSRPVVKSRLHGRLLKAPSCKLPCQKPKAVSSRCFLALTQPVWKDPMLVREAAEMKGQGGISSFSPSPGMHHLKTNTRAPWWSARPPRPLWVPSGVLKSWQQNSFNSPKVCLSDFIQRSEVTHSFFL